MNDRKFHLAQANISKMKAPLESPIMKGFVDMLDPINRLADESEGFIWRLQTEEGNATDIRVFDDNMLIFNMSVWDSLENLKNYVYRSDHAAMIKEKKNWFELLEKPHMVLWWIEAGHIPTPEAAKERLSILELNNGPTQEAFTFKHPFEAPST